ncbi:hypothetical protein BGX31_000107, partial [Mortierella sp. GBA43]
MVPVIVNVLESFYAALKSVSEENERRRRAAQHSQSMLTSGDGVSVTEPLLDEPDLSLSTSMSTSMATASSIATMPNTAIFNHVINNPQPILSAQEPSRSDRPLTDAGEPRPQQFFYREDDILHALQLLAYLSKYPSLRSSFHTESGSNVFAIVEKFTHRNMHPLEIQYWAGVIMRNACRKDDTRKGIRQCAYTGCGKWETKPREFAKCRRCRKAKYCSKVCQSKAWNEGHRWWCLEKKADSTGMSSTFGTDLPPAPPPPPPPADLQDQPEAGPSLMENGSISSMASGAAGARMIGGGEGGSSTGRHVHGTQQFLHPHYQQLNAVASSSLSAHSPAPQRPQMASPAAATPAPTPAPVARTPTPASGASRGPYWSQEHLLQRQQLVLPQQPQVPRTPTPQQQPHQHSQSNSQQMQMYHQQQPRPEPRFAQASHQPQNEYQQHRAAPMGSQRSMSHLQPSTAPIRSSPRADLVPHLGISPDSPTPEQLAQRFVQQVALHPGQHNELAKRLHAQFQQFFPPHHQAEAKRQFSVHAREHFARYQRQQELLRQNQNGRPSAGGAMSFMTPQSTSATPSRSSSTKSLAESDVSKQGTPRRRSDLDSDDEDASRSTP